MSIPLPPLPPIRDWPHSHEELRARDLEVARVVLEAAALIAFKRGAYAYDIAAEINALEVKHG